MIPACDDPAVTAYLLGELSEDESCAFEERMAEEPELASEVADMRPILAEVSSALAVELMVPRSVPMHEEEHEFIGGDDLALAGTRRRRERGAVGLALSVEASTIFSGGAQGASGQENPAEPMPSRWAWASGVAAAAAAVVAGSFLAGYVVAPRDGAGGVAEVSDAQSAPLNSEEFVMRVNLLGSGGAEASTQLATDVPAAYPLTLDGLDGSGTMMIEIPMPATAGDLGSEEFVIADEAGVQTPVSEVEGAALQPEGGEGIEETRTLASPPRD